MTPDLAQTTRNPETIHAMQHVEIVATDPHGLKQLLAQVFGWRFETHPMGEGEYHMFRTPDGNGGGILAPQGGQPVAATPYVNVRDAEATRAACEKAGATIVVPITEVPGMGRFFWFQAAGAPPLACWEPARAP